MKRKCSVTIAAGRPCKMAPLHDSDRCFIHDPRPEIAKKRDIARSRGGRMRRPLPPPRRLLVAYEDTISKPKLRAMETLMVAVNQLAEIRVGEILADASMEDAADTRVNEDELA